MTKYVLTVFYIKKNKNASFNIELFNIENKMYLKLDKTYKNDGYKKKIFNKNQILNFYIKF